MFDWMTVVFGCHGGFSLPDSGSPPVAAGRVPNSSSFLLDATSQLPLLPVSPPAVSHS